MSYYKTNDKDTSRKQTKSLWLVSAAIISSVIEISLAHGDLLIYNYNIMNVNVCHVPTYLKVQSLVFFLVLRLEYSPAPVDFG